VQLDAANGRIALVGVNLQTGLVTSRSQKVGHVPGRDGGRGEPVRQLRVSPGTTSNRRTSSGSARVIARPVRRKSVARRQLTVSAEFGGAPTAKDWRDTESMAVVGCVINRRENSRWREGHFGHERAGRR
jgi:hypothetical protein